MLFDKNEFYGVTEGRADVAVVHPELGEIIFFVQIAQDFDPEFWVEISRGLSRCSHVQSRRVDIVQILIF